MKKMPKLTPDSILQEYMVPSKFQVFTQLSKDKKSVNLGQGFPNWRIPDFIEESLDKVLDEDICSDNFSFGSANLLNALCQEYSPIFQKSLNPMKNVMVSSGGVAVLSELCSSLSSEDEAIIIEPYFSFYEPMLRFFRTKLKFIQLIRDENGKFSLDLDQVKNSVTSATKWIFFNSPHNPTGKVYSQKEYQFFADLAKKFPDLNFISDEVYENIYFGNNLFPRLANIEGLWERTISVFSGGKTYSCTGWRVGWAIGPEFLMTKLKQIQHFTNTAPSSLIQETVAKAIPLGHEKYKGFDNFYIYMKSTFLRNVQILEAALVDSGLGFEVISPEGGYFLTADISDCITKMPVYYLFSEETRKNKENLKNVFLDHINDYQQYEGFLFFLIFFILKNFFFFF
jgi:kynurenine--oxoglutarate transaminase/cysteine-S-conjugate beta-lyase/glutamine--phenylpyruvate transaminase